jgi:tRNA A-37 threonylcarbamoyl transferase component Bud32
MWVRDSRHPEPIVRVGLRERWGRPFDGVMAEALRPKGLTSQVTGGFLVGKLMAGRYRIEAVVDEGRETVLYTARHEALGKRVALKVLLAGPGRSKEAAERFLARAKLAASLGGPHVNRISDFGQSSDGSYFVMDWLEGQPLSAWLEAQESFPFKEVLTVVGQVGRALSAAHGRGVVHGRLEARRLYRVRQGEEDVIKVLGFGAPLDAAGEAVRADVRALGEVLLEMASRARFDDVTTFAVRRQRETAQVTTAGPKVLKLPAALQAIVVKALARETSKGYRGVDDLCSDLERFGAGEIPDALLEMIASGSWALIPETGAVAAIERAAARAPAPKPSPVAPRAPVKPAPPAAAPSSHRQTALTAALVALGLGAGWVASGWMAPSDEVAVSAQNTALLPHDFRPFGPDE